MAAVETERGRGCVKTRVRSGEQSMDSEEGSDMPGPGLAGVCREWYSV